MAAIRPISPELQKVAIEELNEVPERIADDIAALRKWIEQQPHLKARTDDQILVSFLRGCKYSLEKAKSKIDRFYMMRTKYPEYFLGHKVNLDELLKIFRLGTFISLPNLLHENGPRIGLIRLGKYNPNEYNFTEINRAGQLITELTIIEDDHALINGVVSILDMSHCKASHFLQITPALAKKYAVFNEEAVPLRPKAFHFINISGGFERLFNMFKPMMSEKQRKRVFVHGSQLDSFYEQIPQKYLPIEYGGENGSIEDIIKDLEKRLAALKEHFEEENNYGTDERLRVGQPIDFESVFGIDGSFRKLEVD